MVDSWNDADISYFEDLFQVFDNHSYWEYDNKTNRNNAAEKAVEQIGNNGREEFSFKQADTGATLHVGIPDLGQETPCAISGTLFQSITHPEYDEDDELISELDSTQEMMSRERTEDVLYVQPNLGRDVGALATIQVPFDYEENELDVALDALSDVSESVDEMHSSLLEEIRSHR